MEEPMLDPQSIDLARREGGVSLHSCWLTKPINPVPWMPSMPILGFVPIIAKGPMVWS